MNPLPEAHLGMRISGWGVALPERVVTNDELSQTLDTSNEWILERSGIAAGIPRRRASLLRRSLEAPREVECSSRAGRGRAAAPGHVETPPQTGSGLRHQS